jgi:glycosyltransferase involved in cell wall biosynthesis
VHVLFLTQIVPYPPDAGPKVKTWHVLRYLVQRGHQVTLVTFYRDEETPYLENLKELCHRVIGIPMRRSRLMDVAYLLKSNLTGRPFIIERDDLPPFRQAVEECVRRDAVDVIHADQLGMAQFALPPANHVGAWPATLFDAHNAVWTIVERMGQNAALPLKPVLALETQRVRQYEADILQAFTHTLAVSEPDAAALLAACLPGVSHEALKAKMTVIPIAVDTATLTPVTRQPGSQNILTMGTLHYPPNADGIRWFANEVFPRVRQSQPAATLTIVGKNPPADFVQLAAKHPGVIHVTGYVPDLTPYMQAAALMAVPVRAGGGIRVRILEAFARAMPVVTTTVGLEGIHGRPGLDVLVADDAASQAAAVTHLMADETLQQQLAANGRALAETQYDWQVVLAALDEVYARMEQRKTSP